MNQFKDVFLGREIIDMVRAANVQKCIRLNDLDLVGKDGHHHSYFEMMGSWSFGDYFKMDACRMAWELLTGPYQLPKEKLFITYFGGSRELDLGPDLETRDIWLSLGVPKERVTPSNDNFWEMGAIGPCGPCTEIHYGNSIDDLVEVWNLVFVEYNRTHPRNTENCLQTLLTKHVDTGLGLERLAAIKIGSKSNYDSELFAPIFNRLQKLSGAPAYTGAFKGHGHLDTGYRVMADHARMMTVAMADRTFPSTSPRLRNVIRRTYRASRDYFKMDPAMVVEVCREVGDVLGDQYPEIPNNMTIVETVLRTELETFRQLESQGKKALPQLLAKFPAAESVDILDAPSYMFALRHMSQQQEMGADVESLSREHALKMYDSMGLTVDGLREVFAIAECPFNEAAFTDELNAMKLRGKYRSMIGLGAAQDDIPPTDDSFKYEYKSPEKNKYVFGMVGAMVEALVNENGEQVMSISEGEKNCCIYVDKTVYYAEEGGQVADTGSIFSTDSAKGKTEFKVNTIHFFSLHSDSRLIPLLSP
jgi:alanyl-tRNA synthetase